MNFGGAPMMTYYPVYLPPMVAPPQAFCYVYQEMGDDAYKTLQIDASEFRFYKDDLTEETEKMMESMMIPMYGPKIQPIENQGDLYGGASAAETNFMHAQTNSQMRFEGEVMDPNYGNKYVGERDPNGFRQGYGTFTFSDGSLYMGQWWQGLRHGFGEFRMMNGAVYKGQWGFDLKHGFGKFYYAGVEITGVWLHDRMNGRAIKIEPNIPPKELIYKDDLEINYTMGGLKWW
jgi:hypothetical protein